jgi:hypothetical protein
VETFETYQGRATHLFAPAFNRDVQTFDALAEAGTRLLVANVVVANNGFYGGSIAVAPYYDPHKRTVAKLLGNDLETALEIDLPFRELERYQTGADEPEVDLCARIPLPKRNGCEGLKDPLFKNKPGGWRWRME